MIVRKTAIALALLLGWAGTSAAGPALLFDAANGRVLYAEDQDQPWHPASLTKIMTAYLVFEALKNNSITLEQKIPTSANANAQPPSKLGLPVGAEITINLALNALIVKSANDAAVMLAEAVGGTEEAFVRSMNATAMRLGMTQTRFVNPHGLPAPEQVTTARDLARLTKAVIADHPRHAELWAKADMQIGRRRLRTHNGLLRTYEGADGFKTGFICDSGFNVVATATRDNRRLVAVVLGEYTSRDRSLRAASLLEHGFRNYGWMLQQLPIF
jgi:D-alanyl-D-alanine carboxypeptidase